MPTHRTTCRVIYGDTDNMGQAYYGNYFRWFEMGRNELFRSMGLAYSSVEDQGIFLPVAEAYCKYVMPAKYDDRL
ncbi:MAG: thioesterase family protein, partial [Desulfobacterales bacterium]